MAVISTVMANSLRVGVQTGMNDRGVPIIRNRTFNRLNPNITDDEVFLIGTLIGELQDFPVNSIRKVTEVDLIG